MKQYDDYRKPSFSPPGWLFGPVWTILYILIAISFGIVFVNVGKGKWPFRVAIPFIINLAANLAYYPLQFGAEKRTLATVDIFVVLGSLVWMFAEVFHYSKKIAYMQIPYLAWVSFATVLQVSIWALNR